jgi:hypothetical protein
LRFNGWSCALDLKSSSSRSEAVIFFDFAILFFADSSPESVVRAEAPQHRRVTHATGRPAGYAICKKKDAF